MLSNGAGLCFMARCAPVFICKGVPKFLMNVKPLHIAGMDNSARSTENDVTPKPMPRLLVGPGPLSCGTMV